MRVDIRQYLDCNGYSGNIIGMLNATKIRLYPNPSQEKSLAAQFGCARWVWNEALAETKRLYEKTGKGLGYHAMTVRLPGLKSEFPWLKDADSQVLQQSLRNLHRAFKNFFEHRARYPRFKHKDDNQSIQYPQRVEIENDRIYLPKVGLVKCIVHRPIAGGIKTITVSKDRVGRYHAAVLTEDDVPLPKVSIDGDAIGNAVGIDAGLINLAVTSDELKLSNPRHLVKAERNLKRKQKSFSRKQKGSNRRAKARVLVARAHARVADSRRDHLHKVSRRIVNENQVIVVEDLNVTGMMKNRNLAKAIADAGFATFSRFLEYKAARAGKVFIKVGKFFPSTKTCSECGSINDLTLDVRHWTCSDCGSFHDRDVNAARNIRNEGLRILAAGAAAAASGGNVSRGRGPSSSDRAIACEAGSSGL